MNTGKIVFGPSELVPNRYSASGYSIGAKFEFDALQAHACNCIGPQPGETKCPCSLRAESQQGRKMVQDGVTINGKRYKLVEA